MGILRQALKFILRSFFVIVIIEITLRCLYFQLYATHIFAVKGGCDYIVRVMLKHKADKMFKDMTPITDEVFLSSKESEKYFKEYRNIFQKFIKLSEEADVKIMLLYIGSQDITNTFFKNLAEENNIPLLNSREIFSEHSYNYIYLLPQNGHLSRYGNQMLAVALSNFLKPWLGPMSKVSYEHKPKLLGDLKKNDNSVWLYNPEMPYRVITNSQGLRRNKEVYFFKQKTRVLFIGDSYTFGPYLENYDCYPQLLGELVPEIEAINAGIAGYTICDEYSYFKERGKYIEPDIVVLQVSDNDIYGLLPQRKKIFCRGGEFCIYNKR